jgi:hypothetical protein
VIGGGEPFEVELPVERVPGPEDGDQMQSCPTTS